jgi:hypothetical protein
MPNSASRSVRPVRKWREAAPDELLAHSPEWVFASPKALAAATRGGISNSRRYLDYQLCLFGSPRVYL